MKSNFQIDMSATVTQSKLRGLEQQFIKKVNTQIATKVTPIYNIFLMVCAAFFGYFVINE